MSYARELPKASARGKSDACESCAYRDGLQCKRAAPSMLDAKGHATWPQVRSYDWCGEDWDRAEAQQ